LTGKPDLTIHTLTHFLDRFIYRNAKASVGLRGSSIMQPLAGSDSHDLLVNASGLSSRTRSEPLNSEAFWRKQAEDVAAEDVFFHEYFNRLGKDKHAKKSKKSGKAGDEDGEGSDNESEIWQALGDSRPELEGDDDDDDLDMDDLESAYDESGIDEENDGGVIFNDASDDEDEMDDAAEDDEGEASEFKTAKAGESDDDNDEDAFDMDVSDEEAFRDSDEDVPSDFEVGGVEVPSADQDAKGSRQKKRKLRHLPTFASADDYAALLADEDDGQM
jgi:ribosome biogenesis protein MAK21